ncbi:hypothetical protein [Halorarius litoreus]|uniref:hypothetical protein n=1 Tax=Halorarius litoreus TaxID=2962676 RepID=UPI0020CF6636|nr:hypothetical protein [Halorarius litoreus]
MAGEVTHLSEYATQQQNVTGQPTTVLDYQPEDGTRLQIKNKVAKGDEEGVPIYMDLRDSGDNPLPNDTEVILEVDVPSRSKTLAVSEKLENIAPWNAIALGDQRNEENVDAVKVELEGAVINVRYFDVLSVIVTSSAQVDWANSEFYMDGKATRTVPHEE